MKLIGLFRYPKVFIADVARNRNLDIAKDDECAGGQIFTAYGAGWIRID